MKIAKLKLPRNLREPSYKIKFDEIDTFWPSQNTIELLEPVFDEEIGNPEGVICYEARPHDDASFGGHFLLLAVKGQSHWMTDIQHQFHEFNAERGALMIVNSELVEHFNGTWTPNYMGIYSQWFNK